MCPSYLDGDHALGLAEHAVIPVCWHGCAVFKVRRRGAAPGLGAGLSKLNSMRPREQSSEAARSGRRFGSCLYSTALNAPAGLTTAPILELP
jgi:hypothetical protein